MALPSEFTDAAAPGLYARPSATRICEKVRLRSSDPSTDTATSCAGSVYWSRHDVVTLVWVADGALKSRILLGSVGSGPGVGRDAGSPAPRRGCQPPKYCSASFCASAPSTLPTTMRVDPFGCR